jgi:hypothetical protein
MVILPETLELFASFALAYRVPRRDAIAKMLWLPSADPGKNGVDATNRLGSRHEQGLRRVSLPRASIPELALRLRKQARRCVNSGRMDRSQIHIDRESTGVFGSGRRREPANYKLDIKQAAGCAAKVGTYIVRLNLVESGGRSLFCNNPRRMRSGLNATRMVV